MKTYFCYILVEKWNWKYYSLSHVRLFATPRTGVCQAPLSIEFSRLEYWSGLLFSSQGELPNPGIKHRSLAFQADYLPLESQEKPSLCPIDELIWANWRTILHFVRLDKRVLLKDDKKMYCVELQLQVITQRKFQVSSLNDLSTHIYNFKADLVSSRIAF